ncbi:preprotein translocase subunit SecE [Vallitalea okinawensis]|uniref:preprotein translocase subunit SecE n=1 Tax=Vallitalea okinawensis TaxID=2078660 RepID=UPI000CFAB6BE|nr:preprotein translocase subunit SecE [Vallitalea okinawensis]
MKSILKGLRGEFKKIVWPNPKELSKKTITVLVVVTICALLISVIDMVLQSGVTLISNIF